MSETKQCTGCGADFERTIEKDGHWRMTRYCSTSCQSKARAARAKARRASITDDIRRRWLEKRGDG